MGFVDPQIDCSAAAYVHPSAFLYGRVTLGENASVWINAAMRAEMHEIRIGAYSNIQDFVMVHVGDRTPTIVGSHCSITHHVTLHGCTVGDNCLIGINATLMDGVVVGENSIVAGHTILSEGTVIPPNSIVMGVPGKVVKTLDNSARTRVNAMLYHRNALAYSEGNYRAWSDPALQTEILAELERLRRGGSS